MDNTDSTRANRPPRSVVLLSGGLDSFTAAALAKSDGFELYALSVRYGQIHAREIEAARNVARALGVKRHLELDVDLAVFGGSALTGDGEIPKDRALDHDRSIPSTYVPARNTVLLSLALAWAEVLGAVAIVIGVNVLDYSGYPDCRPEYLEAFEGLATLATRSGVEGRSLTVLAPLLRLSKAEIIRQGISLGLDYGLTHSCYDPVASGAACGRCDSCRLRARGFEEAGVSDPLNRTREPAEPNEPVEPLNLMTPVTERIYYTDPYATEFDATVVSVEKLPGADGDRRGVVLDRTAFYPTSGGQPFDVGVLGAARVLDVVDRDDGSIVHIVEGDVLGEQVHGKVDWPRRFDHMQQHTGQHVLSAAFDRLLQVRTVSFHLGVTSSTIDLSREVSGEEITVAEIEANRVVWDDRPVTIRFADAEDVTKLSLRKEPVRDGVLRLIDVEGFDLSACGGTHVARTGAIGIIAAAGSERFRGGTRLEFLCGARALSHYRSLRDSVTNSIRLLSVLPAELPAGIERVQSEAKELTRQIRDLQTRLASYEAAALAARASASGPLRLVVEALEGWDANGLRLIASSIAARPGHVALLFSVPPPSAVVIARAPDVSLDCAAILARLMTTFGGKGGGRPALAQGGGLQGEINALLATARGLLDSAAIGG